MCALVSYQWENTLKIILVVLAEGVIEWYINHIRHWLSKVCFFEGWCSFLGVFGSISWAKGV